MLLRFRLRHWVFWLALAALYFGFLFPSPEYPVFNDSDGGGFLALALNMLDYGHYTMESFPVENWRHHVTWPPGFPLLLATVVALAGLSWFWIKAVIAALGLGTLYLLWRLFPEQTVGRWAILLTALNPLFFVFSHHHMSEIPYFFLLVGALLAVQHARSPSAALVAGMLGTLAFFTRGYAVTLIPAGILYFVLLSTHSKRQRLILAINFALPMIVAVLAWKTYTSYVIAHYPVDGFATKYGTGADILSKAIDRPPLEYIKKLYWYDGRYALSLIIPFIPLGVVLDKSLLILPSLGLLGLAAGGWWVEFRRRRGILEIWLPIALTFLQMSGQPGFRYWLTYLPFLVYYILISLRIISQRFSLAFLYPLGTGVFLISAAVGLFMHLHEPDHLRFHSMYWKGYRDSAMWAEKNLEPDAIVVAHDGVHFFALSRRATWPASSFLDGANWPKELINTKALYILCPKKGNEQEISQDLSMSRRIIEYCETLGSQVVMVYRNADVTLYRLRD